MRRIFFTNYTFSSSGKSNVVDDAATVNDMSVESSNFVVGN